MEYLIVISLCAVFILIAGFYSGMETAAYSASRLRLRYLRDKGSRRAGVSLMLMEDMPGLVANTLIGHNIAVYCGTMAMQNLMQNGGVEAAEFWATAILTPFCFIFAETGPKHLGHVFSVGYCVFSADALRISAIIFKPLAVFMSMVSRVLSFILKVLGLNRAAHSAREVVLAHLDLGRQDGMLTGDQLRMARSIMDMERREVMALLRPFGREPSVKKSASCTEVAALMRQHKRNWIPVVDRKREIVHGIITTKMLLGLGENLDTPAEDIMPSPVLIDASQSVGRALSKLQNRRSKVGVVIEGERALGYVLIRDLVAETLGRLEQ